MKIIYTAGPYRSSSQDGTWENIVKARAAARKLWLQGWVVICPHANSMFMNGDETDGVFLKGDLEILARCDAIYMLAGWTESKGAVAELDLAKSLDLEVLYE